MRMRIALVVLLAAGSLQAGEKVQMKDLPPGVQKAIQEEAPDSTVVGITKAVERGKTLYEAELKGKTLTFDSTGKMTLMVKDRTIRSLPAAAAEAIRKAAGSGQIVKLQSVDDTRKTLYVAQVKVGDKTSEVKVDENGNPVK